MELVEISMAYVGWWTMRETFNSGYGIGIKILFVLFFSLNFEIEKIVFSYSISNFTIYANYSQSPSLRTRSRYSIIPHAWCARRWISDCYHRRGRSRDREYDHRPYTPAPHTSTQYPHAWTFFPHHQCPDGPPRRETRPWLHHRWILGRARIRRRPRTREYGPLSLTENNMTQVNRVQPKTHQSRVGGFFICLKKWEIRYNRNVSC